MRDDEIRYAYARPIIEAAARRQDRLTFDEAVSVGNLSYVRALRRHGRDGRGRERARNTTFARHLAFRVKKDLLQAVRDDARQRHGLKENKTEPALVRVPMPDPPEPGHWSDALSPEAAAVVRLALSMDRAPARKLRRMILEELADLGWAASHVLETFKEIAQCLP